MGRGGHGDVEAQVGLPGGERLAGQQALHLGQEGRLAQVEPGRGRGADGGEVVGPAEVRGGGLQRLPGGVVPDLPRVAPVHAVERRPGQRRLEPQDLGGAGGGPGRGPARELEHALDQLEVAGPELPGGLVVGQVLIAVGEPEAAGAQGGHHLLGVLERLLAAEAEEEARRVRLAVEPAEEPGQARGPLERLDRGEVGRQRLRAGPLHRRLVHAGGEVVAQLPLHRGALRVRACGRLLEQPPEVLEVLLGHLVVDAPVRAIGRDGVGLLPAGAAVGVEVAAGVHAAVHGADVEPGRVGEGGERPLGAGREGDEQA